MPAASVCIYVYKCIYVCIYVNILCMGGGYEIDKGKGRGGMWYDVIEGYC